MQIKSFKFKNKFFNISPTDVLEVRPYIKWKNSTTGEIVVTSSP